MQLGNCAIMQLLINEGLSLIAKLQNCKIA